MIHYDIGYGWMVVFVIGSVIATAIGIAAGLRVMWDRREKRDGKA
jgi:hypothetical protein